MNHQNGGLGLVAARALVARAKAILLNDPLLAPTIAAQAWGDRDPSVMQTKAAVIAGGTNSGNALEDLAGNPADVALVRDPDDLTLIGRMQGVVPVGPTTPYLQATARPTASFIAEGKAIKATTLAVGRDTVSRGKVACIVAVTAELLEDPVRAAPILRTMITQAVQRAIDSAAANPANTGVLGQQPAAIPYGAVSPASFGTFEADLGQLVDAYAGDWNAATLWMHPALAARVAVQLGGRGLGAGLGARGGEVAGIAALTSEGCPRNRISLVDASAIALLDQGAEITMSREALLELDTAPAGAALTPTAASQSFTALFGQDAIGIKIVRRASWAVVGKAEGRVVTLETDYLAS